MNCTQHNNLRLVARNEGKLKSYESCSDVRAWSHDVSAKDRHLREWIKADMPICVIPVSTLSGFLRTMTCKSRRRVAPRCHPDCKSKVLLDSICTSCHAMRSCLKQVKNFENYFVEEELETSAWPCERCLEALKSIKLFWKIIIDRIFQINISKSNEFQTDCNSGDCVRSVAKTWQNEMVQQAVYVENFKPSISRIPYLKISSPIKETHHEASQRTISSWPRDSKRIGKTRLSSNTVRSQELKDERDNRFPKGIRKKLNRSTHVDVKAVDAGCDTCFLEDQEEIKAHKKNLQVLQEKFNERVEEVDRLKRENNSLRIELGNVYKSCPWKASFYPDTRDSSTRTPKPFEGALEESCPCPVKNIDSEMIITMKKCKNENFRHVSMLQVLHKTNDPRNVDSINGPFCKKEDPIQVLNKVQNTFGAIVKREISIAMERRHRPKKHASDIEATFHKLNSSRSAPSCSTSSSRFSSEGNFVSAKETNDRYNIMQQN